MKTELRNISHLVNEKISVSDIIAENYISTENMLPDKCGITKPSSVPKNCKVTAYRKNDVLVSNIRPYFKKIWFAENSGGCSNDVLVFRADNGISPEFLYYTLSADRFFEYSMKTSKGTKMPRGDKKAIMDYIVNVPDYETQKKTGYILRLLDRKIELNNKINKNLEEQAQAIFKSWFVDFDTDNTLSDICCYSKDKINVDKLTLNTYYSTENMLPNRQGALQAVKLPTVKKITACKKGDVLISNIRPYFKKILYCYFNCGCSADVLCFVPYDLKFSVFLYFTLYNDKFFDYMLTGSKGTKMPRGDKQYIMNYPVYIPSLIDIEKFNKIAIPLLELINVNRIKNKNLSALRDALLPKLLNEEIKI